MYEYIEGKYKGLNKDYVILDNQGIGYKIFTSGNSICSMPEVNSVVKLYIEQIIRQDFIGLYGFVEQEELEMFKKLININGIGSKAALSLLSVNTVDALKKAIFYSDEISIMKANGIGKKGAQRIILELKDKFKLTLNEDENIEKIDMNVKNDSRVETVQALLSLGFDEKQIEKVLKTMESEILTQSVETIIKESLKRLMR